MEALTEYLIGVVESSYQDLEHLVPCGTFLGLFDERPIKRSRITQNTFDFDDSETTYKTTTQLVQKALATHAPLLVLRTLIDAIRNINDASPVLDIAFRALLVVYRTRVDHYRATQYSPEKDATFGAEYLELVELFELHRPRTWVAAVRLVSMITKSAIQIMYGDPTQSEFSGVNLIPERVCRLVIRRVWRLLLDSSTSRTAALGAGRRTRWQIRFEATMELFDCFVGRAPQCAGRPLVSYYKIARELDPGAAVAESGVLGEEMQAIVDLSFGRKRRLGRILLPPDGSWPMISHASRAHTAKHVYDQAAYAVVRDSLTFEETERGPSANRYVADLLYQRAPTDEIFAAIRNHRNTKRKAMAAIARAAYVPGGGAGETESEAGAEQEVAQVLLDSVARRAEQVIKYIRSVSDFETLVDRREPNANSDSTMVVPTNIKHWELMNEVADQLYYFVLVDAVPYRAVHARFYETVFPKDSDIHAESRARRDNGYIWLLLQLLHIEKVSDGAVREDLSGDEDMLDELLQMYNEEQIVSRDAFYLRDLALQAALSHQHAHIRDNQGMKFRHPRLAVAMPFAPVLYRLQREFAHNYKDDTYDLLDGSSLCNVMKVATVSQFRQYVVANTLYTYLVPGHEDIATLQGASTTYLRGGNVGYRVLDYMNVGGKHRLLQLVYKMMLAHELGPQFQHGTQQPRARADIACVGPPVVDTVYRLLYNAPYSNELMMKEVLEKLRRCDKLMAAGGARLPAATLRWLYTVYQLMTCRLLRFFKYYAHAAHLVHHLRHSLAHVSHRQLYGSLECFALCLVNLQHDVEFLQALMNPEYHGIPLTPHASALAAAPRIRYSKPSLAWFECAMLARNAVVAVARIVIMRGMGDVPGLAVADCLDSLSAAQPLYWAPATLRYFPPPVRAYYAARAPPPARVPPPSSVRRLLDSSTVHRALLLTHPDPQAETELHAFYAERRRHPVFLCALWVVVERQGVALSAAAMGAVRRLLLTFPLSQMAALTALLVDFVVACEAERGLSAPSATTTRQLDDFMFVYHVVRHEHVVFALTRGEHDLRSDVLRRAFVRFVLLDSPQFARRLAEWQRLDFKGRYWADRAHATKQHAFLDAFPDVFEYEAALPTDAPLDPPRALALPAYYENAMVRLLPVLDFALARLIEAEDRTLLRDVLDRTGALYRLHQVPLTTLMDTLFVFFDAPTLHDAPTLRSLARALLDTSQQTFSHEFEAFLNADDAPPVDTAYVSRMLERIARVVSHHIEPRAPGLPEIHYREIPNPILLALTECVVELLTWWCLHCARTPRALHDASAAPRPATEREFRAEERDRDQRALDWPLARTWLELVMDPAKRTEPQRCAGARYIHSTGVLANVLPDALMAFPFVHELTRIIDDPLLKATSASVAHFSFVAFAHGRRPAAHAPSAATRVFNSFEHNRAHGSANQPNTYLTLLHSILHYGGVGTFTKLAETIHAIAQNGPRLTSDVQLLYLCATVGPILYRLVKFETIYVQVIGDLISIMAQVCPMIDVLDVDTSTDALGQVIDFFCFVKEQFDPGREAWRRVAPHIAALPALLRYQLQCIIDQE